MSWPETGRYPVRARVFWLSGYGYWAVRTPTGGRRLFRDWGQAMGYADRVVNRERRYARAVGDAHGRYFRRFS